MKIRVFKKILESKMLTVILSIHVKCDRVPKKRENLFKFSCTKYEAFAVFF